MRNIIVHFRNFLSLFIIIRFQTVTRNEFIFCLNILIRTFLCVNNKIITILLLYFMYRFFFYLNRKMIFSSNAHFLLLCAVRIVPLSISISNLISIRNTIFIRIPSNLTNASFPFILKRFYVRYSSLAVFINNFHIRLNISVFLRFIKTNTILIVLNPMKWFIVVTYI